MSLRLQRVDELIRHEHTFIAADDECFFLREYTAGAGFEHGDTNNIISNLKKKLDKRGKPEWRYKERDIVRAGRELRGALGDAALQRVTIVPMPPSRMRNDPMYDDRLRRIVEVMVHGLDCDVRELVLQNRNMTPAHESGDTAGAERVTYVYDPDEIARLWQPRRTRPVASHSFSTPGPSARHARGPRCAMRRRRAWSRPSTSRRTRLRRRARRTTADRRRSASRGGCCGSTTTSPPTTAT